MKNIKLCFTIVIILTASSCTPSWKSASSNYTPRISAYSSMLSQCTDTKEECQRLYEKTYGGCNTINIEGTRRCWDEMTVTYH